MPAGTTWINVNSLAGYGYTRAEPDVLSKEFPLGTYTMLICSCRFYQNAV